MQQLEQLLKMIKENTGAMEDALRLDLGRHPFESSGLDIAIMEMQIKYIMKNLRKWMQPSYTGVEAVAAPAVSEMVYEPYGVCLLIGPFNYPIQLVFLPLASAIAAGNCVVVKPSEIATACESLNVQLIKQYLDPDCVSVFTGGVPVVQALLEQQWDKIFFTGSQRVGKIVMTAAAKHLTPVSLELGGKSPCYVDKSVTDMELAVRRILWGKFANAGQTCIAPDYILCHEEVYDLFLKTAKACVDKFYEGNPRTSPSYARIITSAHAERLEKILQANNGRVVCGGGVDAADRYVEPTILAEVPRRSKVMEEEIFGPILPVMKVKTADEAIDIMLDHEKPLALYLFGKDRSTFDSITSQVISGGVCVNDTLLHVAGNLPFGGVGPSGIGAYHGKFSFTAFSHLRGILRRDDHSALDVPFRYPPYTLKGRDLFMAATRIPEMPTILPHTFRTAVLGISAAVVACVYYHYFR